MHYFRRERWRLPESAATPEHIFWNRRAFMRAGAGAATLGAAVGAAGPANAQLGWLFGDSAPVGLDTKPFDPKPATNPAYADAGRPVTDLQLSGAVNNFYEFSSRTKNISRQAQALPTDAWTVKLDGEVENPVTLGIEEILAQMPLEERVIRHRCVETWAMVAPWIGFPISALMEKAKPLSSAKFVRFESFLKPEVAAGQSGNPLAPWPYVEGLTIEEAANPLAFMVVGAYGKILPKQFGAPIRMHAPWKYGFKSNKSITRISFTSERPVGYWEQLQAREYGFWANVNPEVSHPRWSQASETMLGSNERIPTQIYNGYGEEVAHLYADKQELGAALYR